MTLLGSPQAVEASVHQRGIMSERETQYHRDLALEVYRQIFDRFGPLPDVMLIQLAHASIEQLSGFSRSLSDETTLEGFVTEFGWVVPQGGEGNYPVDVAQNSLRLPIETRRLIEERLTDLRTAQLSHGPSAPATLPPQPLTDAPEFVKAKRSRDSMNAAAAAPSEILALDYERDVLARAHLKRAACARSEGQNHGYHDGTVVTLVAVLDTQLRQRFGALPPWAEERLEGATLPQLFSWIQRVITVDSLESALFTDESHHETTPL